MKKILKENKKSINPLIFFLIPVLIILFDQFTKFLIKNYLALGQSFPLIKNTVYFTYIQNTGAGFGLFRSFNSVLIWVSVIIIGIILYYYGEIIKNKITTTAFALVLGGAAGNLIDRIFLGYVVDFIDFRFWPAFNVADSAVTIGVIILIIYFLKKK
ncbi:MAG: signal peptidase II [Candidatus Woesearchaeota archaeon]|nr:signal peptidase II [Candidatus Woesearchaeota archaeon]